ncbi:MAG: hypothetical protein QXW62_04020 [Candidatus Methanomethylicaceae archaeon]|nr:hypothetical protein [Candidatus Verstraetearchaeota archaeon]
MEIFSILMAIFIIKEQLSSTDRILGMLPITFACLIIPVIIQVIILFLWAIKWKPSNKEVSG